MLFSHYHIVIPLYHSILLQLLAVKDEVRTLRNQCEGLSTKLNAKDVENGRLWEQMRMAATEYQQEFLTKEATIRQLMQQQELEKEHIREDMIRARGIVEVSLYSLQNLSITPNHWFRENKIDSYCHAKKKETKALGTLKNSLDWWGLMLYYDFFPLMGTSFLPSCHASFNSRILDRTSA